MPLATVAIGTGCPLQSVQFPHFGLLAYAFPSSTTSQALSMFASRHGPSPHTIRLSRRPSGYTFASIILDTSFRSKVVVSWARIVEVVSGSCRPEIPHTIPPNSVFSLAAVCCSSRDHSCSLARPECELAIHHHSPSTRKPSDPTPPSCLCPRCAISSPARRSRCTLSWLTDSFLSHTPTAVMTILLTWSVFPFGTLSLST